MLLLNRLLDWLDLFIVAIRTNADQDSQTPERTNRAIFHTHNSCLDNYSRDIIIRTLSSARRIFTSTRTMGTPNLNIMDMKPNV